MKVAPPIVEGPPCPECDQPMWLVHVSLGDLRPAGDGFAEVPLHLDRVECVVCRFTVTSEEMDLRWPDAARWVPDIDENEGE